jgi:hypothetical protein
MTRNELYSKSMNKYSAPGPSGSAPSCSLEVIREDGPVTAVGLADPRSSQPTHVAVHYDGAALSITATYQPKWRSPVEGSISLPLDMKDPFSLLPLLEGEQPWKAWPEIEALVRQAMVNLEVPRRLERVFDRHLHILRAVRNGPEKSKMLTDLPSDKAREKALFMREDSELNEKISGSIAQMRQVLGFRGAPASVYTHFGNAMRFYQELRHEQQRREGLSLDERMDEQLRRREEEDRSRRRMKGATGHGRSHS